MLNKCKLKIVGSCCCNAVLSKCVVLALLWKLLSYVRVLCNIKNFQVFSSNWGVFCVCWFCHWALQSFKWVCVDCGHMCTYIKLTFRHARHSCSVFTALWCGCFLVKRTFCFHQTPSWLWLVWTNLPVFTPTRVYTSRHNGTNNAWTCTPPHPMYYGHTSSQRIPGLYHIWGIDRTKMADDHNFK